MKRLYIGTEKAAPAWKEWRWEFCWEEEPALAVSGVRLELPEGIPGLRWLECRCRRPEGVQVVRWERELYPRVCTAARQAREVSYPFQPWKVSLTGVVTLYTPERLSLYYDVVERAGGPHGVTLRRGSAWALPGGSPLTLGELFPPGFRWKARALTEVERQLRVWPPAGESWLVSNWEVRLPCSFDPERFYLTEAGPVIYFPLYFITPYTGGIPAFSFAIPSQKEDAPKEQLFFCTSYLVSPAVAALQ